MKIMLACLLVLTLVAGAACTQTSETPPETSPPPATTPETQVPTTPPPTTPTQEETETPPPTTITPEDIEAARQVVFAYREAINNYDLEGALAFLEESWREERVESLQSDISQMENYGIKLGVEEEAEPTVTDDGMVAIYIKLDVPVFGQSDRHVIYYLKEIDGEWKICSHEEL